MTGCARNDGWFMADVLDERQVSAGEDPPGSPGKLAPTMVGRRVLRFRLPRRGDIDLPKQPPPRSCELPGGGAALQDAGGCRIGSADTRAADGRRPLRGVAYRRSGHARSTPGSQAARWRRALAMSRRNASAAIVAAYLLRDAIASSSLARALWPPLTCRRKKARASSAVYVSALAWSAISVVFPGT